MDRGVCTTAEVSAPISHSTHFHRPETEHWQVGFELERYVIQRHAERPRYGEDEDVKSNVENLRLRVGEVLCRL